MIGLENNGYYPIYLPENGKELTKLLGTTLAQLQSYDVNPAVILVSADDYERLSNAVRNVDKRQWKKGLFMGLEVLVRDPVEEKVAYLIWETSRTSLLTLKQKVSLLKE